MHIHRRNMRDKTPYPGYPGIFFTHEDGDIVVTIPDIGGIASGRTVAEAYEEARWEVSAALSGKNPPKPSTIEYMRAHTAKGDLVVLIEPLDVDRDEDPSGNPGKDLDGTEEYPEGLEEDLEDPKEGLVEYSGSDEKHPAGEPADSAHMVLWKHPRRNLWRFIPLEDLQIMNTADNDSS